ncbi:MAG: [NiFe]-hydrogenase assembly chaperone HybE [Candidatus Thiodiazotropha sp.]|nr:[NiFe]-hydrogenase assembly chaperone HybE [Candidatus Thiodiazotropha sp.]MCM8881881.1 [NiFe]-hydrogenase assembly chaperone HybE [Candidatus Thiodiazotropha sp.]MCM8918548.1 [NiFe]-hydrogenase assembly chaperone HybE [Candidatus Thiodiazotropha sp.]
MICPDYLIEGLEQQFRTIEQQRMEGLPLLNKALRVEAVSFCEWNGLCLGVLITPWFMNLMLIPDEGDTWSDMQIGDKQLHHLPSGSYEFILGEEEGIGRYQMCSLFSPMFEFSDQVTAVAAAEAAMDGLMNEAHRDTISTCENEINRRWLGESDDEKSSQQRISDSNDQALGLSRRLEQSLSRRDLLRGPFQQDTDQ